MPLVIFGDDSSFITKKEYGELLYQNPRGIGCNVCHGNKGEGKVVATYKEKGVMKEVKAPRINNIDYEQYINNFKKKDTGLMPKYFLTKEELQTIFFYITNQNNETKKDKN